MVDEGLIKQMKKIKNIFLPINYVQIPFALIEHSFIVHTQVVEVRVGGVKNSFLTSFNNYQQKWIYQLDTISLRATSTSSVWFFFLLFQINIPRNNTEFFVLDFKSPKLTISKTMKSKKNTDQ